MALAALLQSFLALAAGAAATQELTPLQKAELVVVSTLPAPPGVGGILVRRETRGLPRPRGALVFADQEGGMVRAFPDLPPATAAAGFRSAGAAFVAGRATGRALRRAGVQVDLAPVLDGRDGPLGRRQFRRQAYGVAFARGLLAGGEGACAKHFPGLGSTKVSTDDALYVPGRLREWELRGFRAAERAGVPCVMVGHAFYPSLGRERASMNPTTYRLLRREGFEGVAITDDLSVIRNRSAAGAALQAARAGADLLLFAGPGAAESAIRGLLPAARRGELDVHVARVLALRERFGVRR